MTSLRFTDRTLRSLSTERAQRDVNVPDIPGLFVRVTKGGRKTFVLRYRRDGRQRRLGLGHYPQVSLAEARSAAYQALGDLARGAAPALERRAPSAFTFENLAKDYIERWAKKRKKTWSEDQRLLDKDLIPAWGQLPADGIRRTDVLQLLDRVVERGSGVTANRLLALVRKMYNWGLERELVSGQPCAGVSMPARETRRDDAIGHAIHFEPRPVGQLKRTGDGIRHAEKIEERNPALRGNEGIDGALQCIPVDRVAPREDEVA
ncbi:MAG: Arm DNA-binding domain-containing protein, partial [Planctomycetota bacterium]